MVTELENCKNVTTNATRFLKLALPHLALYLLIFGYLLFGAWAFKTFEYEAERVSATKKLEEVEKVYEKIAKTMKKECGPIDLTQLYNSLSKVSSFMENRPFHLNPYNAAKVDHVLPSRWDTMSSILYALSILTTTGYGFVTPQTAIGKIFSMGYGFIGIPLMFLAAVDIGRFLSDMVLKMYSQVQKKSHLFGFCPEKNQVISQVETKALKVLTPIKRKSFSRKSTKSKSKRGKKNKKLDTKRLPLSVNASILLLFCMLGGLVYIAAGGSQQTFFGAFFVTFNLVANLTMAEMPTDISRAVTVLYITVFVTFGLAVLSMCAELAAGELKWIFLKIHYFGRKINWKRKQSKKMEQIDMEVKELLKIINQIRAKYPDKREITPVDLLKYVQELNGNCSTSTINMFMAQHRRDTIAFMPQSIEALKFADEMDLDESGKEDISLLENKEEEEEKEYIALEFFN